jgi:hypothetical protein
MKKSSVLSVVLAVLLISMISLPASAQTPNWNIQWITQKNAVNFSQLVLDPEGNPHICYVNNYSGVTYASMNGTNWSLQLLPFGAEAVAFAFDTTGKPTICLIAQIYLGHGMQGFFNGYATLNGSSWDLFPIPDQNQNTNYYMKKYSQISMTFDAKNNMHICFPWVYGVYDGSGWKWQNMDANDNIYSLALDENGTPYILFSTTIGLKYLRYATYVEGNFIIESFKVNSTFGSLVLDKEGKPHISYSVLKNGVYYLNYASWNGTTWDGLPTWQEQTVYTSTQAIGYNSLAFDGSGNPCISFGVGSELKFASYSGNDWNIQNVDFTSDQGGQDCYSYTSLVLDQEGKPHIAYYDWASQALKYAYSTVPIATDTPTQTTTPTQTPIHLSPIDNQYTIIIGAIVAAAAIICLFVFLGKRESRKN